MKKTALYTALVLTCLYSCSDKENGADAYGSFEATDITISSEVNGKIIALPVETGSRLHKGDLICSIDTTLLVLQKAELETRIAAIKTRLAGIKAQIAVIDQQKSNMVINFNRVKNMLKENAATQKQYDELDGQLKVLEKQRDAQLTQKLSVTSEIEVLKEKMDFINEQIRRCFIYSPIDGTVLEKYVELFELTGAGKPLVKIADLSEMNLIVYASSQQVGKIKINDSCTVLIDSDNQSSISFPGIISWISEQAEFTPKIILTKQVRVNLVYAVKIRVANDGRIKIGMPGEAIFRQGSAVKP